MGRHNREIPKFVLDNLDNLGQAVQQKGCTIKEAAHKAGLSSRFVSGLGKGTFSPTKDSYNKLAVILGWEVWQ